MTGGTGVAQQRRLERCVDDVVDDAARRRVAHAEGERRLAGHAERGRIDDQVEAAGAIVEGEIGRRREMVERRDMMLAARRHRVEQRARLSNVATGEHDGEAVIGERSAR